MTSKIRDFCERMDTTDSNTVANTYTWGLDLSGDLQDAGGVGGLLSVTVHSDTGDSAYYLTYDGNGNVSEYVDDTDSVVAHYEYSPFGKITSSSGSKAADFNHRFSTKYLDDETALYYYGYRYYSSELGRWISRDPIQEEGGLNVYCMVSNNSVMFHDYLGLSITGWMTKDFVAKICYCDEGDINCKKFTDFQAFTAFMESLDQEVKTLAIRSHGVPNALDFGKQGLLTTTKNAKVGAPSKEREINIVHEDKNEKKEDLTGLFKEKLAGAKISLNGCQTGRGKDNIARDLSNAIPDSEVDGGKGLAQLAIPLTTKGIWEEKYLSEW